MSVAFRGPGCQINIHSALPFSLTSSLRNWQVVAEVLS